MYLVCNDVSKTVNQVVKSSLKLILLILVSTGGSKDALANHAQGADISYRALDSLKFEITFRLYRFCNGVSLSMSSSNTSVSCTSSSFKAYLSPTLVSIENITPICDSATKPCNPPNTGFTGEGVEMHTYRDTLDLTSSTYASLIKNCCQVLIEYQVCCRSSNITTGAANKNFYTSAMIDICKAPKNSSPFYSSQPFHTFCCNQPLFYNVGAADTSEFDSLSYAFDFAHTDKTTTVTYKSGYAYNNMLTAYYPGSLKFPYTNVNANPPIGIYLNPENGNFIITPTKCDEISPLVIKVTEWRKDSSGKYQVIGFTKQDMIVTVKTCPGNNSPIIDGPYSYNVCAGSKLCFNITTDDKVKVPPPPAKSPPPDTVRLSWNKGIPKASFKIINDSALHQTAQFCWTPELSDASTLPYQFTVTASDNHCPLNSVTSLNISIRVKTRSGGEIIDSVLSCSRRSVDVKLDSNFDYPAKYFWEALDSSGSSHSNFSRAPYFSNGYPVTVNRSDVLQFTTSGKHILRLQLNNKANCPITLFDTIDTKNVFEARLAAQSDTFHCRDQVLTFQPNPKNAQRPLSFWWYNGDTTETMRFSLSDTLSIDTLRIHVRDSNNCIATDEVVVMRRENPKLDLLADTLVCADQPIILIPKTEFAQWDDPRTMDTSYAKQGSQLDFEWTYKSKIVSTDSAFLAEDEGIYTFKVKDSTGCFSKAEFELIINEVRADAGEDRDICYGDTFDLRLSYFDSISQGKTGVYRWWNITNASAPTRIYNSFMVVNKNELLELRVYLDTNGLTCMKYDTIAIQMIPLPVIKMSDDLTLCCYQDLLDLRTLEDSSSRGGNWVTNKASRIQNQRFYNPGPCDKSFDKNNLVYTYTDSGTQCTSSDSMIISSRPLPPALLNDLEVCTQKEILSPVKDGLASANLIWSDFQYNWSCLNCSGNLWDSSYRDSGNNPMFAIDNQIFNLSNNTYQNIKLTLQLTDSFTCMDSDTAVLRVLGTPKINRNLFIGNEPYQFCSEDDDIALQWTDYPSKWSLQSGEEIVANMLTFDTLTVGYNALILTAGTFCPSDTITFKLDKNQHIDFLVNDTSMVSSLDLSIVLKIKAQNVGRVNWYTNAGASLDASTGLKNILFFPHNKSKSIVAIPVWVESDNAGPCTDKTDTTFYSLRPDPCTFFKATKSGMILRLTPADTILSQYIWKLDNGKSSTAKFPEFELSSNDSFIEISLTTVSAFDDSCTTTLPVNVDLLSINRFDDVNIYPNPVKSILHIQNHQIVDLNSYEIINVLGEVVQKGEIKNGSVDCSILTEGFYFLRIHMPLGTAQISFQKIN